MGISIVSICCLVLFLFENDQGNLTLRENPLTGLMLYMLYYCTFLLAVIIYIAVKKFVVVTVDNENKTIQFKNVITRYTKEYDFNYFDGYLDSFTTTSSNNYKVIFFVKNKRKFKRIDGYYYKNIDEIQTALSSMNYFGFQKNLFKINKRIILNKEIID